MKKPLALLACLMLAGCGDIDVDHWFSFDDTHKTDADAFPDATPAARPAALTAAAQPDAMAGFCRAVATQDASSNSYDPATQQRVFAQSYSQCIALYAR